MIEKGYVFRVSGSLVIAENVPNAKMGDVVHIGHQKLLGEIVRILGNKVAIQCFEDTSGLRPGEPVINTNRPLVAELGPGLLGQIYDGLQMPEKKLFEETQSPFVKRGYKIPPLDYDKKWEFVPEFTVKRYMNGQVKLEKFTVKVGDKVEEGSIIGSTQETRAIEHKVMVPIGTRGKIVDLREGKYNIKEPIATIELPDGTKKDITMLQYWPVRKPRPYKEHLPLTTPLITGQRVIDIFFPIPKGGAGAIPGGFGTGKCVLPDTPVLLEDGTIISIEKLFEVIKGAKPDLIKDEEIILVDRNIAVYTFDGRQIRPAVISHIYRGFANKIVEIKTSSGRRIRVTMPHKLIVFDPQGYFKEQAAAELKPGDYIAIPRKISIRTTYQPLTSYIMDLDELRSRDDEFNRKTIAILRKVAKNVGGYENLARMLNIKKATLVDYSIGRNKMPLKLIRKIYELAQESFKLPRYVGFARSKKAVRVPNYLDEKLGELLGLLLSDGMLTSREIRFFNNNEDILIYYAELFEDVFGVKPVKTNFKTVKGMKVDSCVVVRLLEKIGVPIRQKSRTARVPSLIFKSPETVIAAFIRGYYLGDGSFSKGVIEFNSASEELIHGLGYLFTRLGILYSIRKHKSSYRLVISSIAELKKFIKQLGLDKFGINSIRKVSLIQEYIINTHSGRVTRDLVPLSVTVIKELLKIISKRDFEEQGISIGNYAYGNELMSITMFDRILQVCHQKNALVNRLTNLLLALEYVALDKIEEIIIKEGKYIVYDVTVPETHNFVGGDVPSIFHNTVTLHQLARWCDADVVVYIGCGERGNEMADVIAHFPQLRDPRTGKTLSERSIFIANVSNLPVFAREASIYMGVTLAEYYRDMGYDVALMADSTSRWAEALRDISGRLEEIPAERGYPAYLADRIASFYERSGRVITLGRPERIGSITILGATSPPGGDFSEPVTSTTVRFIGALYALDKELAFQRHFPAINWLLSFSKYARVLGRYWTKLDPRFLNLRKKALLILEEAAKIEEIARIVGEKALPDEQRQVLLTAEILKHGFLYQNAFHEVDTYCEPQKQIRMLRAFLQYHEWTEKLVREGELSVDDIRNIKIAVRTSEGKVKEVQAVTELEKLRMVKDIGYIDEVMKKIKEKFDELATKYGIVL
ncbi:MAG: ATP synthase beta subunit C-terminal domain-containing protein [Candidatus Njordarchaeales archaeon]